MGINEISKTSNADSVSAKKYKESSTFVKALGSSAAFVSVFGTGTILGKFISNTGRSVATALSEIENYEQKNSHVIADAVNQMYNESGLREKGVKILDYKEGFDFDMLQDFFGKPKQKKAPELYFQTQEELEEWIKKNPRKYKRALKRFEKGLKDFEKYGTCDKGIIMMEKYPKLFKLKCKLLENKLKQIMETMEQVKNGSNAFAFANHVHVNSKGAIYTMLSHECGHVKNNINLGFGKLAQLSRVGIGRIGMLSSILIFGTAILRDKKPEGQKSDTLVGKGLDFIKDNCVALAAGIQTPTLIEEGLASAKGLKMIKNYVKPNEFKMLRGAMGKAWMTYFATAATMVTGVFVADAVKNLISGPKKANA